MKLADHVDKIEADVQRVSKLMRGLGERCYEVAEEQEHENFRFEALGIVAIIVWTNEDGDEEEDSVGAFESKRRYVQTGMLVDLLASRLDRGLE